MRAARLLTIMRVLQAEGRVTAGTLARRLEVSERTILRDLDELGSTGVPVFAVRGPQGGFELLDTYRGDRPAPAAPQPVEAGRLRRVRVRISPAALRRALVTGAPEGWRARPAPDPWPDRADWLEGSFRFTSDDDALRSLAALAPEVEVLLPVELRNAMRDLGRAIAARHGD